MILGDDGARLSKRHGAVSVVQYREQGILPEALLNYLVRLGWSHGDQEIFSIEEMINLFDIEAVNKSASAFNTEKLHWLNQHYIKAADPARLATLLQPHLEQLGADVSSGAALSKVVVAQQERAKTLVEMAEISAFFYQDFESYEEKAARKNLKADSVAVLRALAGAFEGITEWEAEPLHQVVLNTAEELDIKLGKVAQPLRVAVCGRAASPPIDITLELLGKTRTIARITRAITHIESLETA
jgi:glutamyl-tRNA synthetase